MSALENQVLGILEEYVSSLTARSLLRRALEGCALERIEAGDVPQLISALEGGLRLFVPEGRHDDVLHRLGRLGGAAAEPSRQQIPIEAEGDIVQARSETRTLATSMGADAFATQQIITAVSELTRNIVAYAGSGTLELHGQSTPRKTIRVIARDEGPGIADLDRILAGRYRSRTGLGRGLLGIRRMAESFDVRTGESGTTVTAEFAL